jgi:hypothetical protein
VAWHQEQILSRPVVVHFHPLADLVKHELAGDTCVCGPRTELVSSGDGAHGWLIVHHSLDGRERSETSGGH